MAFRFRRSVRLLRGVRLNLSKSGPSVSFGGHGFTYNVGPKGTRTTLGIPGTGLSWSEFSPHGKRSGPEANSALLPVIADETPLVPIESAPVEMIGAMSTSELAPILSEVSQKIPIYPFVAAGGVLVALVAGSQFATAPLLIGTGILTAVAFVLDQYRRSVAIDYEPSGVAAEAAEALGRAFNTLRSSERTWRIEANGRTSDWKRNAGATSLNKRASMHLTPSRPSSIRGTAAFPSFLFGRQKLYLLPDAALFVDGRSVTALHYRDLTASEHNVNFIEEERVPGDTVVVGNTWRFVNRNGGPDRRFNNNRQLPVCHYNELDLTSQGGLNGRLQLSKPDVSATFVKVLETLARFLDSETSLRPVKSYRKAALWPTAAFVSFATAFFLGTAFLAVQLSIQQKSISPTVTGPSLPARSAAPKPTTSTRSTNAPGTNSLVPMNIAPPLADDRESNAPVPLPHIRPRGPAPTGLDAPMVLQPGQ